MFFRGSGHYLQNLESLVQSPCFEIQPRGSGVGTVVVGSAVVVVVVVVDVVVAVVVDGALSAAGCCGSSLISLTKLSFPACARRYSSELGSNSVPKSSSVHLKNLASEAHLEKASLWTSRVLGSIKGSLFWAIFANLRRK
jgi:hypothetical protein